jgi:hypothetical protein
LRQTKTKERILDEYLVAAADDGIGLAAGDDWPRPGRLGALIVQSLKENARARVDVESKPDKGIRVTICFAWAAAVPSACRNPNRIRPIQRPVARCWRTGLLAGTGGGLRGNSNATRVQVQHSSREILGQVTPA